jgi:DNA modification methylase
MAGSTETSHRLRIGDARDLSFLSDGEVQLVVTSPPYWQIKDYGPPGQIGFGQTFEKYIDSLNQVWRECSRVLSDGCRICINVGDQFSRAIHYGRYKVVSIQAEIICFCESIGLDYMGTIIWKKVTTTKTTGGASIMGSFPYPRNGMVKVNYEHILLFKKPGHAPKPNLEAKERSKLSIEEWNAYFSGIWTIPGVRQTGHVAMFPLEIPTRLIRMYSFWGETVLDPFVGSGTTMAAAAELQRNSVGVEIDAGCSSLVADRFGNTVLHTGGLKEFLNVAGSMKDPHNSGRDCVGVVGNEIAVNRPKL